MVKSKPVLGIEQVLIGDKVAMTGVQEYKGREYFCVRYMYEDRGSDGAMKPSTNGINVPVEDAEEFLLRAIAAYSKYVGVPLALVDVTPV